VAKDGRTGARCQGWLHARQARSYSFIATASQDQGS